MKTISQSRPPDLTFPHVCIFCQFLRHGNELLIVESLYARPRLRLPSAKSQRNYANVLQHALQNDQTSQKA